MPAKKRALGRGLDSLIALPQTEPDLPTNTRIVDVPTAKIRPNINQPRTGFDEKQIVELAESIREVGIMQPLLVRERRDHYELIAGERRFRASLSIGFETVPCLVVDVSDEKAFEMGLIENLQREDLNPLEEGRAYQSLIEQFGLTQEKVAERVGKSRPAIANTLRLLNLPLDIQEDILENRLSPGHARAILTLEEAPKQRNLRNIIIAKGLSVRSAEALARKMNKPRKRKPPPPSEIAIQMRSLQEDFSMKIGVPVFIKPVTAQSGKVEIHYHSLDDFELISDFFGVEKQ